MDISVDHASDPRILLLVELRKGYTVVTRVAGMRAEFTCVSLHRVRACARVRVYASNYAYVTVRVYSLPEYLFTRVYLSGANCRSGLGEPEARMRVCACAKL